MLKAAAHLFGVDVNFLAYGSDGGDPFVSPEDLDAITDNEEYIENNATLSSIRRYTPSMPGGIAEIDVLVGAGDGRFGKTVTLAIGEETYSGHPVVAEWTLSEKFVEYEMNLANKDTLILRVIGDSMMPTYLPGDRVIVDMRQKVMTVDGVYIISDGDEPPQIKRLHRVRFGERKEIDVISDNPLHPVQRGPADQIHIIGRVAGRISAS